MSRELKFRVYSFLDKEFIYFHIGDYPSGIAGGLSKPQQFTGFFDRVGKEIYEGDIFKDEGREWGPVEFKNGQFQVNLLGARIFSLYELFDELPIPDYPLVIGNIK